MSKRDLAIIWAIILTLLLIGIRQNLIDTRALKASGVTIKSLIYQKSYVKGTNIFGVKYAFRGKLYVSECRSNDYDFPVGDSINIRINARNPAGYCTLVSVGP